MAAPQLTSSQALEDQQQMQKQAASQQQGLMGMAARQQPPKGLSSSFRAAARRCQHKALRRSQLLPERQQQLQRLLALHRWCRA
jgi:hypothetical protein